jgi:hypothetical protein
MSDATPEQRIYSLNFFLVSRYSELEQNSLAKMDLGGLKTSSHALNLRYVEIRHA